MTYHDEPTWVAIYLDDLERHGMPAQAARTAGVTSRSVEKYAGDHPDFEQARLEAAELFADTLEAEAIRRARDGTIKGVYFKGDRVDEEIVYSDTLMMATLKAHRGARYGDKKEVNFRGDLQIVLASTAAPLAPGQSRELQAQRAAARMASLPHPTQAELAQRASQEVIQQRVADLLGDPLTLAAEDFL